MRGELKFDFIRIIILWIILLPFSVFAATDNLNISSDRYYGYFQTIQTLDNTDVMLSYFNNGYVEDDTISPLQTLSSSSSSYRLIVRTYSVYRPDSTDVWNYNLNESSLHFYELDICVSTNKLAFEVWNSSNTSDDFASNSDAYYVITKNKCSLYSGTKPDDVVGPAYWEWLQDYDGYVAKVFLPISQWKSTTINNQPVWELVSRFIIHSRSEYPIYYRFLTSGGLYDHSRWFEIDNTFNLDTLNFDLTYDAVMDGIDVLDNESRLTYFSSKNLFRNFPFSISQRNILMNNNGTDISFVGTNDSVDYYPSFTFYADGSVVSSNWWPTFNNINSNKGFFTESNVQYIVSLLKDGTFSGNHFVFIIGFENSVIRKEIYPSSSDNITENISNNSEKINFISIGFLPSQQVNLSIKIQIERGNYQTNYCPYGPTTDITCQPIEYIDYFTWDDSSILNNIYNIIKSPLVLGRAVKDGVSGSCVPLSFTIFNQIVSIPCGDFFWQRSDITSFKLFWNLLFGGFIIFKLIIWDLKILNSTLDPASDGLSNILDTYSSIKSGKSRSKIDKSKGGD